MSSKRQLQPAQAERVRKALERVLRDTYAGNKSELCRALKNEISPQAVQYVIDGINSPSRRTAELVARLQGVQVEQLLEGKRRASVSAPPPAGADIYPLRGELRLLSEFRDAPPAVQAYVLAIRNYSGDYARIDDWLAELRTAVRAFERGQLGRQPGEVEVEVDEPE